MGEATRILEALEGDDPSRAEELLPLVYEELRKLASRRLSHERPGQTLQTTALVHEAYVRLVDVEKAQHWNSRGHFFAAAAQAMRRILVEIARRKSRLKHGGRLDRVEFELADLPLPMTSEDLLSLDEALEDLQREAPERARLVTLRYFGGMSLEEAAALLGISPSTADRHWTYSRAWLHRRMTTGDGSRGTA